MLFKPFHLEPVIQGRKIQTRRLWTRPQVKVGGLYPVQTRFCQPWKECEGGLRVLEIWHEPYPLTQISERDAFEEGGYSQKDYLELLARINSKNKFEGTYVTAIRFEFVPKKQLPEKCR